MRRRSEHGAAMLEFALIAPVLVLLVMGIIEYGVQYSKRAELNNLAFIAARAEAVHKSPSAAVSGQLPSGAGGPVVVQGCPSTGTPGTNAVITIAGTFSSPTGLFGGNTFTINAKGVARCDG
ncbi:TadE/TadG family type IV pilus assembly protein [Aeromicrobium terrae]|nr:TadE family protein [Aeromicrobium terrae]